MLAMLRMYAVVFLLLPQILWLQYRWTGWAAGMVITSILAWFAAACVLNTLLTLDFDFFDVSQQKDKSVRHFCGVFVAAALLSENPHRSLFLP